MPRNRFFMSVTLALILAVVPLRISTDTGLVVAVQDTALAKGGGQKKGGKHASGKKVKKVKKAKLAKNKDSKRRSATKTKNSKRAKGKDSEKRGKNNQKDAKPIGNDLDPRAKTKKAEKQKQQVEYTSRRPEKGKRDKKEFGVAKQDDLGLSPESTDLASTDTGLAREGKVKNPRAELGRLNSWNRNHRAYMNSNDPHMAEVRDYARNYIEYEDAVDRATSAQETLDLLNGEYAQNGGTLSDEAKARLAAANGELTAALAEVNRTEALVSDEALSDAILSGANKATGENYVDAQKLDWAKNLLGVGDSYGKIDQIRDFSNN